MKSILKHLQTKVENLEAAAEKAPKDLDYIKKMKNVVNWLESYLYHLEGGLCAAKCHVYLLNPHEVDICPHNHKKFPLLSKYL